MPHTPEHRLRAILDRGRAPVPEQDTPEQRLRKFVPPGTPSIGPPDPGDDFEDRIAPGLTEREAGNQFLLEQFSDLARAPERGSAMDFPGGELLEFLGDAAQVGFLPLDAFGEAVAQAGQALPGPVSFGARAKAFTERPIGEQIGFGLIDPLAPLIGGANTFGRAAPTAFRRLRSVPRPSVEPALRAVENVASTAVDRLRQFLPDAPTNAPPSPQAGIFGQAPAATPEDRLRSFIELPAEPPQIGTRQPGFGIGEEVPQAFRREEIVPEGIVDEISDPQLEITAGPGEDTLTKFQNFLNDRARVDELEGATTARTTERARRFGSMEDRVDELVEAGVPTEDAINLATKELAGPLPGRGEAIEEFSAPELREELFREVFDQLKGEGAELRATATALDNALAGIPIPRKVGTEGGSAFIRLQRVFGEDLTEALAQPGSLEDIIRRDVQDRNLGLTGFQGARRGDPGPVGDVLNLPQTTTPRMALGEEFPPFAGRPADPRPLGEQQIDLQKFREATGDAPAPTGASGGADIPGGGGPQRPLPDELIPTEPPIRPGLRENVGEVLGIPRSLLATSEFSSYLRQGGVLARGHPITASKAMREAFTSMFSEANFQKGMVAMEQSPEFERHVTNGKLYFARDKAEFSQREEVFANRLLQRVPVLGRVIRGSERNFVHFLNKLRLDVMSDIVRGWEKGGVKTSQADLDKLAEFINHASGRGDLGAFEQFARELNVAFFAPRLTVSRFQLLTDLLSVRRIEDPLTGAKSFRTSTKVRKVIAKDLAAFFGSNTMLLWMLSEVPGVSVGVDPRSSEFGKVRIGKTRIDLFAGFTQIARYASQAATGKGVNKDGKVIKKPIGTTALRYLRGKLNPPVGLAVDLLPLRTGDTPRDFLGKEIDISSPKAFAGEAAERLAPLFYQDLVDAFREEGLAGGVLAAPAAFGIGVQSFEQEESSRGRGRGRLIPGISR